MSNAAPFVQGPVSLTDGTGTSERQSRTGEMLTSNVHAKYYDQAFRGKLFHCDFGVAATGLAISAIGTSPGMALFNPAGSGVNLGIISVRLGIVSGTFVLGTIMHAVNTVTTAAATTGTAGTIVNGLVGSGFTASGKPLYTATLPANPTQARVFAITNATAATGQTAYTVEDLLDGSLALAPGTTWSLLKIGTDTTPLWKVSITWEEVVI